MRDAYYGVDVRVRSVAAGRRTDCSARRETPVVSVSSRNEPSTSVEENNDDGEGKGYSAEAAKLRARCAPHSLNGVKSSKKKKKSTVSHTKAI